MLDRDERLTKFFLFLRDQRVHLCPTCPVRQRFLTQFVTQFVHETFQVRFVTVGGLPHPPPLVPNPPRPPPACRQTALALKNNIPHRISSSLAALVLKNRIRYTCERDLRTCVSSAPSLRSGVN